jgi:hypothetical protein
MRDYFHPTDLMFEAKTFCRRYRISKTLFLDIIDDVREYDDYFGAKLEVVGKVALSSYQKCSAAIQ